jgi:hypothetical protein
MQPLILVSPFPQPYSDKKKKVFFYKMTFLHLGVFLLALSGILFLCHPHWILADLYLGYCWLLKGIVGSFAGFLGVFSVLIASYLKVETEAVTHIWTHAKQRLHRIHLTQLASAGANRFSYLMDDSPEVRRLRARYLKTKHDMVEEKHLVLTKLRHLKQATGPKHPQWELLVNNVLLDYERKIAQALLKFEKLT